jgi:hypothetical protein
MVKARLEAAADLRNDRRGVAGSWGAVMESPGAGGKPGERGVLYRSRQQDRKEWQEESWLTFRECHLHNPAGFVKVTA